MPKGVYQRKHAWVWTPEEVLRAKVLRAAREILAAGEDISAKRLRARGVRGASDRLGKIRAELVASGDLPPEAGAGAYSQAVTSPPFRCGPASPESPPSPVAQADPGDKPSLTRAQRRTRRLVRRYNRAVRNIFGRDLARQIGAAPSPKPPPATMPPGSPSM